MIIRNISKILTVIFLFVGLWVVINDPTIFAVTSIDIHVNVSDSERPLWSELNEKIKDRLGSHIGRPLWKISLREIKKSLEGTGELENLNIEKIWPHTLNISYSLPQLKAIHPLKDGTYKVLNKNGNWIGPVPWARLPSLPWVRNVSPDKILKLLEQLPQDGPMKASQISEISFSETEGFLLTLIRTGQQIRFGFDEFEIKSLRVSQVLEYLEKKGLESRVIDANFSKKVLVRLRNQP